MARFEVYVTPGSSRPGPDGTHDGLPRLRIGAAPTDGRANAEAERVLTKLLGSRVTLVRGSRSRRKTFEVDLPPAGLRARVADVFGGYGGSDGPE
jgi:uncharacterized protein YggU (UPF0235/DUF167 family)